MKTKPIISWSYYIVSNKDKLLLTFLFMFMHLIYMFNVSFIHYLYII